MSSLKFALMAWVGMPIRNLFMPPSRILAQIDVSPGCRVLDFGCGPGHFAVPLAARVGPEGIVYAQDNHPIALRMVEKKAAAAGAGNVKTILSGCGTGLDDESIDPAVFLDVYHMLDNKDDVLRELHRVLTPAAALYFSDHHMSDTAIAGQQALHALFTLRERRGGIYCFVKADSRA
jgi:ubiquinone/menaquinone biosynthesis C-methylase UbiE